MVGVVKQHHLVGCQGVDCLFQPEGYLLHEVAVVDRFLHGVPAVGQRVEFPVYLEELLSGQDPFGLDRERLDFALVRCPDLHRLRKRVQRLMRVMGLRAIYRRPRTSQPAPEQRVYPYLLEKARVTRPNQVWAADITYVPMARGFLYLVAVMDWHSRYVLACRLSNTLEADFCVDALTVALEQVNPEVFSTDQGSQFTSQEFTQMLQQHGVKISMDGKGRYQDNIFVERLWRTVKYEEVYLKAYVNAVEARRELGAYFRFYNNLRPHQALGHRTPAEVFFGDPTVREAGEESIERRCSDRSALGSYAGAPGLSLSSP